ncbi:hypothetical protein GCM10028805_64270 [Spirosoma harenae]
MALSFILVVLNGVYTPVLAQRALQKPSLAWQATLIKRYAQNWRHTLESAKRSSWFISKNYSNQRVLQLQGIDAVGEPIYYSLHNTEAARGTRTLALQGNNSFPITLSGGSAIMAGKLGLWDGGRVLDSHQEFSGSGKITHKDNGNSVNDHTTHLAGTLVGKGVNPLAKGMAFEAQLSVWDYSNDISELATAAPNLLISNHAYGPVLGWVHNESRPGTNPDLKWEWWGNTAINSTEDYLFGFYSTQTEDLDQLAYNNPYFLMVRSADNKRSETGPPTGTPYFLKNTNTQSTVARSRNDAYDVIPADATAKNVLTIGAADLTYPTPNQPTLVGSTSFSGWGPTDDGRIKPDLLGVGSDVLSSISTSNTEYGIYSGTSMASANVSGSLFLLQELYARQRGPGLPTGGQFMRAATLKGLAIHTANRQVPEAGPDYRQGWGLLNTEAAARLILNQELAHLILEQSLSSGGSFTKSIVAQGSEPLVVTLSWTDPEATATTVIASSVNSRTPKLINDLDIRLNDGQQTYLPFVLDPNRPAQAATRGDNMRDNVEQIYIADPVPGKTYTLTVTHKGKMTYSSQPYSIILSGLKRINCQLSVKITPNQDTTICPGTPLLLKADQSSKDLTYKWFRDGSVISGATASTYQASQAGAYTVRIANENGCTATSSAVQLKTVTSSARITPAGKQWLCDTGDAIRLEAFSESGPFQAGARIDWIYNSYAVNDAHSTTFSATQPGIYQVRVTQNGCQSFSDPTTILLSSVNSVTLTPEETDLYLPQGATVTLKATNDTSYRYQWYRNNSIIANARDYRLSVNQAGIYKVQVTQQTCVGWSTDRIIQTSRITATNLDPTAQFMFYPNPTENTLSIRYTNPQAKHIQVGVFNLQGILQQQLLSLTAQNGQFEGAISVQALPPGRYILQLTDGLSSQTAPFVKK